LTALGSTVLDGDVEVVTDGEAVLDYLFRAARTKRGRRIAVARALD